MAEMLISHTLHIPELDTKCQNQKLTGIVKHNYQFLMHKQDVMK